jgi:hypothetical protein
MPEQLTEPSHVVLDFFSVFELTFPVGSRSSRQRLHCGECVGHGETWFGRKSDQRGAFIPAEGTGLISPIEKMGIHPNGLVAVLCSVVVCEQAFRFLIEAATFEVGQCAGEKARHSSIRSNLSAHFNLNVALCSSWNARYDPPPIPPP